MPAPFFRKYNSCLALVVFSSLRLAFVTLKKIIDNKRTTYYIIPENLTVIIIYGVVQKTMKMGNCYLDGQSNLDLIFDAKDRKSFHSARWQRDSTPICVCDYKSNLTLCAKCISA
jgi:hypothetical protein